MIFPGVLNGRESFARMSAGQWVRAQGHVEATLKKYPDQFFTMGLDQPRWSS